MGPALPAVGDGIGRPAIREAHSPAHRPLNTELVKKPKDLLEYVIIHEIVHLLAPTHSERFVTLMTRHYPSWREARAELNELPRSTEAWSSAGRDRGSKFR